MKDKIVTFIVGLFILLAGSFFASKPGMSDNWTGPYFSAAANLKWGGDFLINFKEIEYFKNLPRKQQLSYQFKKSKNLIHYNHNPVAFAYLIKAATLLLPFIGDELALRYFQLLIHTLFCCWIFFSLKKRKLEQIIFFLFYAINPVILKFTAYNFYYFWQSLPSLLLLILFLNPKQKNLILILTVIFLPFVLATRITTVLSIGILLVATVRQIRWFYSFLGLSLFLFIFSSIHKPNQKNIWHTIYVGIGAYKNSFVPTLSDNLGYDLYKEKTGIKLDASLGGNFYTQYSSEKYQELTKSEVLKIFYKKPILFLRNAFCNTFQLFSGGYINGANDIINYFSAGLGFLSFFIIIFYLKKPLITVLIFAPSITFTWFYPPIPAYMFGSYLFLVVAFYYFISEINKKVNFHKIIKYRGN